MTRPASSTPPRSPAAEATIQAIEARTGSEVVVYSQVTDYGVTTDEANSDAQALMDQWGVGRKGFDDGLVILFDLDPSSCHGQIQLYAGPGYRAAYLSNDQRDAIFNNDMLPRLQACDMAGALAAGLAKVDAAATPQNAADLSRGRIINALVGLIVGPALFLLAIADPPRSPGGGAAGTRSTPTTRRSTCRLRRPTSPRHRPRSSTTVARAAGR